MNIAASVVELLLHHRRSHSIAMTLFKRILSLLVLVFAQIVPAHGQCDMQITYTVQDLKSPVLGTLKLIRPDGTTTTLFKSKSKQGIIDCRLEQKGEYRLIVSLDGKSSFKESMAQEFSINGEELRVETSIILRLEDKDLRDWKCRESIPSGHFLITKYSNPSPLVSMKYLYTMTGKKGEFPGPYFSVINESQDTLYGEWLDGYFWGRLSVWKDGGYKALGIRIDTTWIEQPPLYPNSEITALVGSFGRFIPYGKYRFDLYYSTERSNKGSMSLLRETSSFRWWGAVENWHLLTCDFEVDSYR